MRGGRRDARVAGARVPRDRGLGNGHRLRPLPRGCCGARGRNRRQPVGIRRGQARQGRRIRAASVAGTAASRRSRTKRGARRVAAELRDAGDVLSAFNTQGTFGAFVGPARGSLSVEVRDLNSSPNVAGHPDRLLRPAARSSPKGTSKRPAANGRRSSRRSTAKARSATSRSATELVTSQEIAIDNLSFEAPATTTTTSDGAGSTAAATTSDRGARARHAEPACGTSRSR